MFMLNSFWNSVNFLNHLVFPAEPKKKSTKVFSKNISSRSADDFNKCRCSHMMSPAPLENIQTPYFCPVLMICGGTASQQCDCVHLCQHTQSGLACIQTSFEQNQKWAQPSLNQGSLNPLIHPIHRHPSIYPRYPSLHPPPHSNSHWPLSLGCMSL